MNSNSEVKPTTIEIKKKIVLKPGSRDGKDASVTIFRPNRNGSNVDYIDMMAWTILGERTVSRSLLSFNLDMIENIDQIDSVFLSLYFVDSLDFDYTYKGNSGNNAFYIQRITEKWDDNEVTWVNQPQYTKKNLLAVGEVDTLSHGVLRLNVSELAMDTTNNTFPDLGFYLNLKKEEIYSRVLFASSNHVDSTKHPELEVYFTQAKE